MASELCSGVSILQHRYCSSLNILYPFTEVNLLQVWPICFSQVWASFRINIVIILLFYIILHRLISCKLGQLALLRCEHPSAPILFSSKYSIFLRRLICCKFTQFILFRCKHPSEPILFQSKYSIYSYVGWSVASLASAFCSGVSIL